MYQREKDNYVQLPGTGKIHTEGHFPRAVNYSSPILPSSKCSHFDLVPRGGGIGDMERAPEKWEQ